MTAWKRQGSNRRAVQGMRDQSPGGLGQSRTSTVEGAALDAETSTRQSLKYQDLHTGLQLRPKLFDSPRTWKAKGSILRDGIQRFQRRNGIEAQE